MTSEMKQQFTLRITRANKSQLVVILYEMLLTYLDETQEAHEKGDKAEFRAGIRKVRGCLRELMASLHYEQNLAYNLLQLYLYADRELTRADVHNTVEELSHVRMVMSKLHEAYETVSSKDASAPIMANTQTVYAGLTYGRGELTENLADQGSDRGFRA